MRRRHFLGSLVVVGAALSGASSSAQDAQRPRKLRVALVSNSIPVSDLTSGTHPVARAIEDGLVQRGWRNGHNLQVQWSSVEGRYDRLPLVIAESLRIPVDVLVVFGAEAAEIASRQTRQVPIIVAIGGWVLVERGLAKSFARPGGNVTGIGLPEIGVEARLLQLLKTTAPRVTRVAFLTELRHDFDKETLQAAASLGLEVFGVTMKDESQVDPAMESAVRQRADGLLIGFSPQTHSHSVQLRIHKAAFRHRLPAIHAVVAAAESGALMAYGVDVMEYYRRAPYYIDRILRGTSPGDLPIEQPATPVLHLNLRTAKSMGIEFPGSVVAQAARIFE